jgi:hypothetical protein
MQYWYLKIQCTLKITLSWTDKEGNPIANQSLVNNLDLKVVTPVR